MRRQAARETTKLGHILSAGTAFALVIYAIGSFIAGHDKAAGVLALAAAIVLAALATWRRQIVLEGTTLHSEIRMFGLRISTYPYSLEGVRYAVNISEHEQDSQLVLITDQGNRVTVCDFDGAHAARVVNNYLGRTPPDQSDDYT